MFEVIFTTVREKVLGQARESKQFYVENELPRMYQRSRLVQVRLRRLIGRDSLESGSERSLR